MYKEWQELKTWLEDQMNCERTSPLYYASSWTYRATLQRMKEAEAKLDCKSLLEAGY